VPGPVHDRCGGPQIPCLGDGYHDARMLDRDNGFTARCEADGAAVGVLPCNTDDDSDLGEMLIASGDPAPVRKN
jgi:hypothetical protein